MPGLAHACQSDSKGPEGGSLTHGWLGHRQPASSPCHGNQVGCTTRLWLRSAAPRGRCLPRTCPPAAQPAPRPLWAAPPTLGQGRKASPELRQQDGACAGFGPGKRVASPASQSGVTTRSVITEDRGAQGRPAFPPRHHVIFLPQRRVGCGRQPEAWRPSCVFLVCRAGCPLRMVRRRPAPLTSASSCPFVPTLPHTPVPFGVGWLDPVWG